MPFKFCLSILVLFCPVNALAAWEYAGFSGANNEIKIYGLKNMIEDPYPPSWEDLSEGKNTCLCDKETEKELKKVIRDTFGSKSKFEKEIASGTKLVIPGKNNQSAEVEVYGFFFKDKSLLDSAYAVLKKNLRGESYAYIKAPKGVYFAKKAKNVPPRAFIHFVRGYDDTASK